MAPLCFGTDRYALPPSERFELFQNMNAANMKASLFSIAFFIPSLADPNDGSSAK
jgi:hypothetical protein